MTLQCLNPIIAYRAGYHPDEYGEAKTTLKGFKNFNKLAKEIGNEAVTNLLKDEEKFVLLPCRKCVNCQLNRSREWAIRNSLEGCSYDDDSKIFLTLTYDNEHLPFVPTGISKNGYDLMVSSVCHKDLSNFMKELRYQFEEYKIRFFACGEYGGKTKRPHYHLLLYGLPLKAIPDLELLYVKDKCNYYNSEFIEKNVWNKGFVNISTFSDYTAMYVSRYCTKKQTSNTSLNYCLPSEFIGMSLKPGIGHQYFIDNKDNIYKNDEFMFHIDNKTFALKPLKYFDRLYDFESPRNYKFIKDNRKKFFHAYEYFQQLETDLNIAEYLNNEERIGKSKIKQRSM